MVQRIDEAAYRGLTITPFKPFDKNDWYGFAGAEKIDKKDEPLIYYDDNAAFIISGDYDEPGCTFDVYIGDDGDLNYGTGVHGERISLVKALKLGRTAIEVSKTGYDNLVEWCDENLGEY